MNSLYMIFLKYLLLLLIVDLSLFMNNEMFKKFCNCIIILLSESKLSISLILLNFLVDLCL